MHVMIKDVLSIPEFKDVEVLSGKDGMASRVRKVFLIEVPDIYSYIDQNCLLLTTLYPIADKPEQLQNFIPRLSEMDIAGIAIKPGRYIDDIPGYMFKTG